MDSFTLIRLIVKSLVLPPGIFFVILLFCFVIIQRKPFLARILATVTVLIFYVCCTPKMVELLAAPLERFSPLNKHDAKTAEIIVVLAGGSDKQPAQWGGDSVSAVAMQRVHYAASLAKQWSLPLLASGGKLRAEEDSEAAIMIKTWQRDYQLTQTFAEQNSRTTWENAKYSAQWLKAHHYQHVILVTHAWHMPRAVWSFKQFGVDVIAAPVAGYRWQQQRILDGWLPDGKALMQNVQLVNEYIGLLTYAIVYR